MNGGIVIDNKLILFSWNVRQGGGKRILKQLDIINNATPDIVALQEMTINKVGAYRDGLKRLGLSYIVDTFDQNIDSSILIGPRRYGLLIASRYPFLPIGAFNIPWQERVVSAKIQTSFGEVELYNTHIPPGSSNGWIKIDTLEGIYQSLAINSLNHRILCGDFNSPKEETLQGEVITWAQNMKKDGSWKIVNGKTRWDVGERNIMEGLSSFEFIDVFRNLYGYEVQEHSFLIKNKGKIFHRRFDHCFSSTSLNPIEMQYLHQIQEEELSDHSPFTVTFQPVKVR